MKFILCAFALCFVLAADVYADPIVLTPTGGQFSWTHFQGPVSNVVSLSLTASGFSGQATNQETNTVDGGGGLCPINCTGAVTFNSFGTNSFIWSAGTTDRVTVTGTFNLLPNGSIPVAPGQPFPPTVFSFVFTATGAVLIDTPDRFVIVFNDQTAVPEPGTILLLGSSLITLAGGMLRQKTRRRVDRANVVNHRRFG